MDYSDLKKQLTSQNILNVFTEFLGNGQIKGKDCWFKCPWHDDKKPSLSVSVNPENFGLYNCFVCSEIDTPQKKGNLITFLKEQNIQDPEEWLTQRFFKKIEKKLIVPLGEVKKAKEKLQKTKAIKQVFLDFGVSEKVLDDQNIGYANDRYWFPIKDKAGDYVDVRQYDPFSKETSYKMLPYKQGYGIAKLWPIENLQEDEVYIMEGEKDCAVAMSWGLNAITQTAGAASWNIEWNPEFKNKTVFICYDIDKAGVMGAASLAKKLYPFTAQIKIIYLPLDIKLHPKGDFTDYVNSGFSKESFLSLVENSEVYTQEKKEELDTTVYKCILAEASKPKYVQKRCDIKNVLVIGRTEAPYAAPKVIRFSCGRFGNTSSTSKKCLGCELNGAPKDITIKKDDYILTEMVNNTKNAVTKAVSRIVNGTCFEEVHSILEYYTIEVLRLAPNTSYNIEEAFSHVIRQGYYVMDKNDPDAKKIETNKCYNLLAITVPAPDTQQLIHQIYDATTAETNIDEFKLTPEIHTQLTRFQTGKKTIQNKLDEIYLELSNQARIYGMQDMFLLYDLCFHSVISFTFQNKLIGKGWVESVIIGDSGVGKSETAKFLVKHYKAGDFVDGETCSLPGLKGGLSQSNGTWQLQWGRLPINDRRLVIIDEAGGLPVEDIGALSNIRSSGECIIQKVLSDKTRARTRMIWISNPRKNNTGIRDYSHGVSTIKDFFGKPEDVRRVDIAMTAASGEVSLEELNKVTTDIDIKMMTSDACHNLILFAWSRLHEDIIIEEEAEKLILKKAIEFGKKYSSSIPLVEPADIRNKLARLAVSLAVRLYSVDEKTKKIMVTKEHVEYICNWIEHVYSKDRFKYDLFSRKEIQKSTLVNAKDVDRILNLHDKDNVKDLLDYAVISRSVLASIMSVELMSGEVSRQLLILKRCNAITILNNERQIKLNPALLDYLRDKERKFESGQLKSIKEDTKKEKF